MKNLSLIFSLIFIVFVQSIYAQDCTRDTKANEAKTKLEQGKGQGCSYAAQFYAYLCECESKPRTVEQARMLKATLQQIKSSYTSSDGCEGMGSLPTIPNCKVGSKNGGGTTGGKTREEKQLEEFRQSLSNARKIGGGVDAARDRARRVSEELKQLSKISADASPQQIMQQYNQNMQRMNQLEQELKQDIATSNFNTGVDIINDYNTGNNEGAVYGTLGLVGQIFENQQAKKEISSQKKKLQKQKEKRMLSTALQMIRELRESRNTYTEYAANSFSKEREEYFVQLANYYEDYANQIDFNFSYSHTRWASYSRRPPEEPYFPTEISNPTAAEYVKVAERKYNLYENTKKQEYAEGAVRFMNAGINKSPQNSSYYLKLSKYSEGVNYRDALEAYIAAYELNPSLKDEEKYKHLSNKFVKEIHMNYWGFVPHFGEKKWRNYITKKEFQQRYVKPKQYLQNLLNDPSISDPLILYTDLYGGMIFNSPLEVLLYSAAIKTNKTHWEYIGAPPKFKSDNILKMTRILQLCARDNNQNISILIELGADPEMKINGNNAIEIALNNGRRDIYSQLIKLSSDPDRYDKLYKQNGYHIVDQYINSSYDSSHLNGIQSFKQEETVALWMLDNFNTLYGLNNGASPDYEDYSDKIYEARKQGKTPQLKAKGSDFGMLEVVKKRSSQAVNKRYEEVVLAEPLCPEGFEEADNSLYDKKDFEYSTWIKEGGLPMYNLLFPPDEFTRELSPEEKDLAARLDSIGCVLCLDKKSFDEVIETIMSYEDGYALKMRKEDYAEYRETGRYGGYMPKNSLRVLWNYNAHAERNNYPKMQFLQGKVLRPVDQVNETYAHLALLYNRYYSFKAMNEIMPLATITNKRGETVLDYLQVMIVENPQEYYKYALLPGIKELIDWQKPFKGKTMFDVLLEDKSFEIIADLGALGVINKDLSPYVFQMVQLGKFKEIAKISELGNLDITIKNSSGDGGNLLHALVKHVMFVDQSFYHDFEWKLNKSRAKIPKVENIQEKYDLDTFLVLDKDLKRNDGLTPYKVFKFYSKQLLKANYDKDDHKKWEVLLK